MFVSEISHYHQKFANKQEWQDWCVQESIHNHPKMKELIGATPYILVKSEGDYIVRVVVNDCQSDAFKVKVQYYNEDCWIDPYTFKLIFPEE